MLIENKDSIEVLCMGCNDSKCDFRAIKLHRRVMRDEDIEIDMKYCGVCHTDLHKAAGHLDAVGIRPIIHYKTRYPCVPGHELSGIVSKIGSSVKGFKVGDAVGVGCFVDSCLHCTQCLAGNEHKCTKKSTATYQGSNEHGRAAVYPPDSVTLGGYTSKMVVHYRFAILIPPSYPIEMAGPIMCAGVTMYSPLIEFKVKPGSQVGIIGLGGLGQMGIRLAKAMGATVTAVSSSISKKAKAIEFGADHFVVSSDPASVAARKGTLDLILNTIPSNHDYVYYQSLLTTKGIQVILGVHRGLGAAMTLDSVVSGHSRIKASIIGSIKETQDVINLCDKHKIYPDIKVVSVTEINNVYTALDSGNTSTVRYVLDLENTLKEGVVCLGGSPQIGEVEDKMTIGGIVWDCCGLFFCCRWC